MSPPWRIHHQKVLPVNSAKVRYIEEVIENLQRLMRGTRSCGCAAYCTMSKAIACPSTSG